jgi:hypothetical protein
VAGIGPASWVVRDPSGQAIARLAGAGAGPVSGGAVDALAPGGEWAAGAKVARPTKVATGGGVIQAPLGIFCMGNHE